MKKLITLPFPVFLMLLLSMLTLFIPALSAPKNKNTVKIGVYDSRVIVLAYSRSPLFKEHMNFFGQRSDSAEAAGDSMKLKELSVEAISFQHLLHQWVFSTASTAALFDLVKDGIADIAKHAGVDMIVSKFEMTYKNSKLELVDLTDQIAQLFKPENDFKKMAGEVKNTEPVNLDELTIEADLFDLYCTRFGKK